MNGYFQLEVQSEGVFVKIYPPTEGGEAVNIKELMDYLEMRQLNHYDLKDLNTAVHNTEQGGRVLVARSLEMAVHEVMVADVSLDKMQVICRFYPPANGGDLSDETSIIKDLQLQNIKFGINRAAIQEFLQNRQYCKDYVFAKGKNPIHGKDAKIEYFFNTNLNLKPKKNEDGSVDYRDLNTISHVKAGDLLARLIPEDPGTPGMNVFGEEISPRTVRSLTLDYANNIKCNEEKTEIFSEVTGHASLVKGKVFVSSVFEVPADVDNSIGNVEYAGNVHVAGNVKGGFEVRAKGDIIVEGVVEDALLEAGGQIIVKRGIHGMGKGYLQAESNVICQFIENAIVSSGGFVETNSILHSRVSASSEIHVSGKKGFITGGMIRAGALVEAQTIGSPMGTDTRVEVGADPKKKERFQELKESLEKENEELDKCKVILATYTKKLQSGEQLPPERMSYVQKLAYAYKAKKHTVEELRNEYADLQQELMFANHAKIQISKTIYPGVTVAISDLEMRVKDEQNFCQYIKKDGEIVRTTL